MRRARLLTFAAVLLGALWLSATAAADEYLTARQALRPVGGASAPANGGDVTTQATPAGGTHACNTQWVTVANKPSGYAIGNCAWGVHLRRQSRSDWTDTGFYDGGYVFGSFSGCGWIGSDGLSKTSDLTGSLCPANSIGLEPQDFMAFADGCSGTSSCAGTPITNTGKCYEYANVRPWLSGQTAQDFLRTVEPRETWEGAPRLAWRYGTKYTIGHPWNQGFVMVRDRKIGTGAGNWAFVNISCFQ